MSLLNVWGGNELSHNHCCRTPISPSTLPPHWDCLLTPLASCSLLGAAHVQPRPGPRTYRELPHRLQGSLFTAPFFSSTRCSLTFSCFSNWELDLGCSAQWDHRTLLGFHLPVSYWGAAGLIQLSPSRACSPALPVVHVPKQLLHMFCTCLWWEGKPSTTPHGQKQKTRSSYYIRWNSEAWKYLLIRSHV